MSRRTRAKAAMAGLVLRVTDDPMWADFVRATWRNRLVRVDVYRAEKDIDVYCVDNKELARHGPALLYATQLAWPESLPDVFGEPT